jgi:hypothetical protein
MPVLKDKTKIKIYMGQTERQNGDAKVRQTFIADGILDKRRSYDIHRDTHRKRETGRCVFDESTWMFGIMKKPYSV